ncbi:MAG: thioredoxin family protein [Bdellovibrionales bacterium]|nr:thioredoxin family protein [Bdellovibrionales bacterium]
MALTYSAIPTEKELGSQAPYFSLLGVDGKTHMLSDYASKKALVVIFMCNHCPYVIAVQDRINQLAQDYMQRGVSVVGINSNDTLKYPADNFEAMKMRSKEKGFLFDYLIDETQDIARAYGAVCTPDPFVFENVGGKFLLRYHGRIDDSWKDPSAVTRRDLALALDDILLGRLPSGPQVPTMGCSIKWR